MNEYLSIVIPNPLVPAGLQKTLKAEIYNYTNEAMCFVHDKLPTPEDYPDIDQAVNLGNPSGFYLILRPDESGRTLVAPEDLGKTSVSVMDADWKCAGVGTGENRYWIIYPQKKEVRIPSMNFLELVIDTPVDAQAGTCMIRLDLLYRGERSTIPAFVQKFPMPVIDKFYTDPSEGYNIDDIVTFIWKLRNAENCNLELVGSNTVLEAEKNNSVQIPIKPFDYVLKVTRESHSVLKHLPKKPEFTHVESFEMSKCDFDKNIVTLSWKVKNVEPPSIQLPESCYSLSSNHALQQQGSINIEIREICENYRFSLIANERHSNKRVERVIDFRYPVIEEFTVTSTVTRWSGDPYFYTNTLSFFTAVLGDARDGLDATEEPFLNPDALDDTLCESFEGGLYTPWGPWGPKDPSRPIEWKHVACWRISNYDHAEIQGVCRIFGDCGSRELPRGQATLIVYSNIEGISRSMTAGN